MKNLFYTMIFALLSLNAEAWVVCADQNGSGYCSGNNICPTNLTTVTDATIVSRLCGSLVSASSLLTKYPVKIDVLTLNKEISALVPEKFNAQLAGINLNQKIQLTNILHNSHPDQTLVTAKSYEVGSKLNYQGTEYQVVSKSGTTQGSLTLVPTGGTGPQPIIACLVFGPAGIACAIGLTLFFVLL